MIKTTLGFVAMILIMFPFLVINGRLIKTKTKSAYLKKITILIVALAVVAGVTVYSLMAIGDKSLYGGLGALGVTVVIFLIQLALRARFTKKNSMFNLEDEEEDEIDSTVNESNDISEDLFLNVDTEDYEKFDETQIIRKEEVKNNESWQQTMNDLFKDKDK